MFLSLSKKYKTYPITEERVQQLKKHATIHQIPITQFELWDLALTHISFSDNNDGISYERLEFLGDSVLGLCLAELLFLDHPSLTEGKMSMLKSSLANEKTLSQIGEELELLEVVKLGNGEKLKDRRAQEKVLCDLFESTLATIFLQHGLKKCKDFINKIFAQKVERFLNEGFQDFKTKLQRVAVKVYKEYPLYEVLDTEGPDHGKIFTIKGTIKQFTEIAKGRSKKEAEQKVAEKILQQMEAHVQNEPLSPLNKVLKED